MVVKSQIKLIKNLQQKKYRIEHGLFVAEGAKMVRELLNSDIRPYAIYVSDPEVLEIKTDLVELVSSSELKRMSGMVAPNRALGVFFIPKPIAVDFSDWVVALDDVRDPGNLGTIIRLCDWFGIHHLICSKHTVDCYNPKVLQATMGSIARVNVLYTDLQCFLEGAKSPIHGTFMDGDNVYANKLPGRGILVMGNEANGISKTIEGLVGKKMSIPQFRGGTAESLNVAVATSILLSEIRRGSQGTAIQR